LQLTGEVRISDGQGNDQRIIDLTKFSYHFIKPPQTAGVSSPSVNLADVVVNNSDSEDEANN
jgi:hypothetical protein